jgi:hemoglobin-like flavoprotein
MGQPMPQDSIATFKSSLQRCLMNPAFFDSFYELFVGASDEVKEKFKNTDMKRQALMLQDSLFVLAVAAQGGKDSPARYSLPGLAETHGHKGLDIRPELYDVWLDALLEAVKRHDPEHSPEIEEAWRTTLASGIEYMRTHH